MGFLEHLLRAGEMLNHVIHRNDVEMCGRELCAEERAIEAIEPTRAGNRTTSGIGFDACDFESGTGGGQKFSR